MPRLISDLPIANSIRVGRLVHKPGLVHKLLAGSVRLVVHEVIADQSYLSQTGSCTLLSHRAGFFVVTTRHQLGIAPGRRPDSEDLESLRFSSTNQDHLANVPVDLCVFETGNSDEAYHDLLFFRVHEGWDGLHAERPHFFLMEDFKDHPREISFFYGHPLSKNVITHEPMHAHVATAFIDGHLDRDFISHASYYRRYTYEKKEYDVNGFSGGAVFSLLREAEGWRVVLDGIIVRAGNGYLHVVDSSFVGRALSGIQRRGIQH